MLRFLQQDSLLVILPLKYPRNWPVADCCNSGYRLPAAAFEDKQASVAAVRPIAPVHIFSDSTSHRRPQSSSNVRCDAQGLPSDTCECWLGEGVALPEMPVDGQQPFVIGKVHPSRSILRAGSLRIF